MRGRRPGSTPAGALAAPAGAVSDSPAMATPPRPRRILLLRAAVLVATVVPAVGCAPRLAGKPLEQPTGSAHAAGGGAIASAEPAATEAGLRILRAGGNAVDAAVAVALALAVVQPNAGNLGGGGFAVIRRGDQVTSLDFRETAPAAAHARMFLDPDDRPRAEGSLVGPLATAVPGSPAGLYTLQRKSGRLPWRVVVAPAAALARDGFVVTPRLEHAIGDERTSLQRFAGSARTWLPDGNPLRAGTRLQLPALAATLEAYAARGPAAITAGPVAAAIETAARAGGGILTAADLAAYEPVWREPLRFRAFGWEIASMPLPSSGGIILAESLGMLERRGYAAAGDPAARAHLLLEALKRAFADRYLLGDPSQTRANPADLLAPAWLDARAASIDPERATPSDRILPWAPPSARVGPGSGSLAGLAAAREAGREGRDGQTTHLSVADGEGGFVALTTTLNGWFGCGLYVESAGFFLNNEMDDFTTARDQPNLFDLIQGEANQVRPGARPLSSMAPTIAWRNDETLVLGSPNGSRIPTAVLQVFLTLGLEGGSLEAALDRPRLHHQWRPDAVRVEPAVDEALVRALAARGHVVETAPWHIGEVQVVRRRGGELDAAADRRGPGGAGVLDGRAPN